MVALKAKKNEYSGRYFVSFVSMGYSLTAGVFCCLVFHSILSNIIFFEPAVMKVIILAHNQRQSLPLARASRVLFRVLRKCCHDVLNSLWLLRNSLWLLCGVCDEVYSGV